MQKFCVAAWLLAASVCQAQVQGQLYFTDPFIRLGPVDEGVSQCSGTQYEVTDGSGYRIQWQPTGVGVGYFGPSPTVACFGRLRRWESNGTLVTDDATIPKTAGWGCLYGETAGGAALPEGFEGYLPHVVLAGPVITPHPAYPGRTSLTCACEPSLKWDSTYKWCTPPRAVLKVVAIDPGHGLNCPAEGMLVGAIGNTDFPASNPPAGRLKEDVLTVAIALEVQRTLPATAYKVVLTKKDVNSCPTFLDRGRMANNANAKAFVSIHINRPNPLPGGFFGNGTSVLYHSSKPASKGLAEAMATSVSSHLGVNNRGAMIADGIAVLKPSVTSMNAVLLEAARLSGDDELKLHRPESPARIAAGIKAALDTFLGN